ncbi:ATP synthase-coupling factor 6, mitochondrial-like [Babylonia areolata]|uniref:ATP synthase-coupling factor 6, mitochondrial-like n=1 Tax=Babylonia areolata TaxID=304850 RepID=UPI003FD3C39B
MFLRAASRVGQVSRQVVLLSQRNIGISAVAAQKAATVSDPIQQLFLDKIREYKTKSAGGKLVEATPDVEAALMGELEKLDRVYNAKGKDMTQFPSFSFTDPQLESVGLGETKDLEPVEAVEEVEEDEEDNKPYFIA